MQQIRYQILPDGQSPPQDGNRVFTGGFEFSLADSNLLNHLLYVESGFPGSSMNHAADPFPLTSAWRGRHSGGHPKEYVERVEIRN